MNDDIVTRLRNIYHLGQLGVVNEAADEIERLRAEVEQLTLSSRFVDEVYLLTEEGIKLWDKIQAVRGE